MFMKLERCYKRGTQLFVTSGTTVYYSVLSFVYCRFGEFSVILVKDMILPNCVWKAGRTAAAIRTTAVSCLWSLLKNQTISQDQVSLI